MAQDQIIAITHYQQGLAKVEKSFNANIKTSKMALSYPNECNYALQAIRDNISLQKCSVESVADCIKNVSITGLSLNKSLGHAWMVPRFIKGKGWTACLDIGYQGWILMAYETGYVTNIEAYVVYQGEVDKGGFDINIGKPQEKITHRPYYMLGLDEKTRGGIFGAYCLITLKGGSVKEHFLPVSEIHKIRDISKSYQAAKKAKILSIWDGPFKDRMYQKTVILSGLKYVPSANLSQPAMKAMELEYDDKDLAGQEAQSNAAAKSAALNKGVEGAVTKTEDVEHEEIYTTDTSSTVYKNAATTNTKELKAWASLIVDLDKVPGDNNKAKYLDIVVAKEEGKLKEYLEAVFKGKGDWLKVCAPKPVKIDTTKAPVDLRLVDFVDITPTKKERTMTEYRPLLALLESIGIDNFKSNMKDTDYPWTNLEQLCKVGTLHEITEIINHYQV